MSNQWLRIQETPGDVPVYEGWDDDPTVLHLAVDERPDDPAVPQETRLSIRGESVTILADDWPALIALLGALLTPTVTR